MRALWAPWRLEYIKRMQRRGCFLCRMFRGRSDRRNLVLKRGRTCAVVMNRYPYNNGHLMVCPYRHIDDVVLMTPEENAETMALLSESVKALRRGVKAHGFNVGINLGKTAGAGLKEHLHLHVVPRWEGDTNFMPVVADTKVVPQALRELYDQLYPLLR